MAQLRELTFLLLTSALICVSARAQAKAPLPAPTAPAATQAVLPLQTDVADPGRTSAEKNGQGMAGELPLDTPSAQAPVDSSALGGSDAPALTDSIKLPTLQISSGSLISVRLAAPLSSSMQHNGDVVQGTLAAPLTTTDGKTLPEGAKVIATVVSSARVGTIASGGVLSIELTHIDGVRVVTDIRVFDGKPGHKDVADSNPAKGSEAEVPAGTLLQFHGVG